MEIRQRHDAAATASHEAGHQTFGSITRFRERHQDTPAEARSIGIPWLRAQPVGQPQGLRFAGLPEDYARLRLGFLRLPGDADPSRVPAGRKAVQPRIWSQLAEIVPARRDPIAASLLTSLNGTFDLATAQRDAFDAGPAPQLVRLLLGMWAAVLIVITDPGAPWVGRVRTYPGPLLWTIESFPSAPRRPRP